MIKSIGLGMCCLTLAISGVTRASYIDLGGKYGDDKGYTDKGDKGDSKDCHFEVCPGSKLPEGDFKLVLDPCHLPKGGEGICDLKWLVKGDHSICDIPDLKGDKGGCFVPPPLCGLPPSDPHGCGCDPSAVPAPASAAFGGLGVVGIMLVSAFRKRKAAIL